MAYLSDDDAELVYAYARDGFRGDLEADAYSKTLDRWQETREDEYERLEAAHDDPDHPFAWEDLWLDQDEERERLAPLWGLSEVTEEFRDLASRFGWDYLDEVRSEVRRRQQATDYSPRQFVALVLHADATPTEVAANEMDISTGNYSGKLGDVENEHEEAEETIRITERVRA